MTPIASPRSLARGYHVHLNGKTLQVYFWWKYQPHYMVWKIGDEKAKLLKKGKDVLAVYANCEYDRKSGEAFANAMVKLKK